MQLILTHENSDFDAVASQMLAHKLYPAALPMLSRRVNRNVNGFLTLYWDMLPYIRPQDWQREPVEQIILVDTHSLPNVRGVRKDSPVQVIDHHLLAEDDEPLPDNWALHQEATGATATILLEQIRAAGGTLNELEATLALLGIYEDTGSLTYDATGSRDAAMAAWLLSLGARLPLVRQFLEIPLTPDQQTLYQELQDRSEWFTVQEQTIILAQAEMTAEFTDEISSVAHRMRNALVPDVLLLAVQIGHNVQVVLRSATDRLDVGEMARSLGGGGHAKAAAALITHQGLAAVVERLRTLLNQLVQPEVKVREVMSAGVQTMLAGATVASAAQTIQRLGHEGYPVLADSGELVGLLTRRAVDRALSHELEHLEIRQVMRAGRISVTPEDSLELVQQRMIESGWGQIPVVDVATESRILGVVTRTDLINHMFKPAAAGKSNLRELMEEMLAPAVWRLLQQISTSAVAHGFPLYFVGGIVRDMLLKTRPNDIDLVVEGDAIALAETLRDEFGGRVRSHRRFGTAKWLLDDEVRCRLNGGTPAAELPDALDFVTARSEFYERPSALPEVKEGSIKLDLLRRDFTINALAIRLDGAHLGQLLDYYGGQRDLENGLIRVLHSLSFIDDPTRILRAVRLEQRLKFAIEPRTEELIGDALNMLGRTTGERIRHEIELALNEPEVAAVLRRLDELGVLRHLHPDLHWDERLALGFRQVTAYLEAPYWDAPIGPNDGLVMRFILWLLPLPAAGQRRIMSWLRVRRTTREDVLGAGRLWRRLGELPPEPRPSEVSALLAPLTGRFRLLAACHIHAAINDQPVLAALIDRYQTEWVDVHTELDGRALQALGVPRGPQIGDLLAALLAARLDGEIADEAGERAFVTGWLASAASEEEE
ncbi:MAG: CBS domain-containing protein [Ardenticatenales bacterium]|nr:CBS domain-containing protein [Ardenticatenales bacterium]